MIRRFAKQWPALVCVLALLLSLCGCGQQTPQTSAPAPQTSAPTAFPAPTELPAPPEETAPPAETPGPATEEPEGPALFGTPWCDSLVSGNAPEQAPEAKDDLYLHYNRELLREMDGWYYFQVHANENVMTDYVLALAEDGTRGAPADGAYTDRELEQLRIFVRQAEDLDTVIATGISELEPWLDEIRSAETLEELNAVLVSETFPFSPYLLFSVSAYDMSAGNNVFLNPDFLFVDDASGGEYYQDFEDDPDSLQASLSIINAKAPEILLDLLALGLPADEALGTLQALYDLEASYGKDAGYADRYASEPFGVYAAANVNLSLDELAARCPNFPLRETIVKFGKDISPFFTLFGEDWLTSFNAVWTEENLDILKTLTMVKVLQECQPYVDLSTAAGEPLDADAVSPQANALNVCNRVETFTQLIGKIYVADCYTDEEVARFTQLGSSLIGAFRRLIGETDWLSERSREKMLEKLDTMRLNILYPDGGYLDFSDLDLTATEDGGTLLGNYLRLKAWRNEKDNELLAGEARSRSVWDGFFLTTSGGCAYDIDTNSVNILPGFPASQGYGAETSQEELLAIYGWMTAHEISHGFDYVGAQFDACGTANSILDEADLDAYLAIVDRLAAYYDSIEAMPGTYVVGDRVKTEAAADLIGMQLALEVAKETPDFDYELFFRRAAEYMFLVLPDESYLPEFLADEHPLHYLRVNVNAQMYPEFYETYDAQEGDGMYLPAAERIRFWGN